MSNADGGGGEATIARNLYDVLRRIAKGYMSPEQIRRAIDRPRNPMYGLGYDEALEMVLDNIQAEAADAIKGMRRPRSTALTTPTAPAQESKP